MHGSHARQLIHVVIYNVGFDFRGAKSRRTLTHAVRDALAIEATIARVPIAEEW